MNRSKIIALCVAMATSGLMFEAAARPPAFSAIDNDGDGQVSLTEFQAMHAKREAMRAKRMTVEERFARIDADGDGFLTESELAAMGRKHGPRERRE